MCVQEIPNEFGSLLLELSDCMCFHCENGMIIHILTHASQTTSGTPTRLWNNCSYDTYAMGNEHAGYIQSAKLFYAAI